jgi:hypothetical protein
MIDHDHVATHDQRPGVYNLTGSCGIKLRPYPATKIQATVEIFILAAIIGTAVSKQRLAFR